MKYDFKNNKYFRWGLTAFLTIAASICFYYLLFHGNSIKTGFHTITGILMPVLYGLVTAYLLTPVLNYIETKQAPSYSVPFFVLTFFFLLFILLQIA